MRGQLRLPHAADRSRSCTNLEAAGAWPPISESHVEMDGAWALYEAWVRLQHGDIDVALVFGSGKSSPSRPARGVAAAARPVLPRAARPRPGVDRRRSRPGRCSTSGKATERDFAEVVARSRRSAVEQPQRPGQRASTTSTRCSPSRTYADPLRRHDLPPITDGAAAVVLARGDKARELRERPAWIRGIDHRLDPHQPGMPRPHDVGVDDARRRARPATTAARSTSPSCRSRSARRSRSCAEALGLPDGVDDQPVGRAAVPPTRSWPTGLHPLRRGRRPDHRRVGEPGPCPRHGRPGAAAQPRRRSWRGSDGSSAAQSSASARPTTRRRRDDVSIVGLVPRGGRPAPSRTPSDVRATSTRSSSARRPTRSRASCSPSCSSPTPSGRPASRCSACTPPAASAVRRSIVAVAPRRVAASTTGCWRSSWEKQSEGNAQWGLAGGRSGGIGAGGAFAPWMQRLHQASPARPSTSAGWSP